MMNGRLVTVLVFALVVASAASFAVYHFLASGIKQQPTVVTQSKLLVASRDLDVGSLIKEGDLRELAWSGDLPARSVNTACNKPRLLAPIFLVAGIEVSRKRRTATEVTESPAPKGRRP